MDPTELKIEYKIRIFFIFNIIYFFYKTIIFFFIEIAPWRSRRERQGAWRPKQRRQVAPPPRAPGPKCKKNYI